MSEWPPIKIKPYSEDSKHHILLFDPIAKDVQTITIQLAEGEYWRNGNFVGFRIGPNHLMPFLPHKPPTT